MFNLNALFVISLYSQETTYLINVMITLAAVHLLFIITYHIIYYMCGGVMRNRIAPIMFPAARWFTSLSNRGQGNRKRAIYLQTTRNLNIPEVTYNYQDFREPLIGVDSTL